MRILKLQTNNPDLDRPVQKIDDIPRGIAYEIAKRLNTEQSGFPFYYRAMPDEVDFNVAV